MENTGVKSSQMPKCPRIEVRLSGVFDTAKWVFRGVDTSFYPSRL